MCFYSFSISLLSFHHNFYSIYSPQNSSTSLYGHIQYPQNIVVVITDIKKLNFNYFCVREIIYFLFIHHNSGNISLKWRYIWLCSNCYGWWKIVPFVYGIETMFVISYNISFIKLSITLCFETLTFTALKLISGWWHCLLVKELMIKDSVLSYITWVPLLV